jgi:magnesium chelatase family protein
MDEFSEFGRQALEALRQPLEDGRVAIVRGQRALVFPTRVILVAATNPCPCGFAGTDRCRCGEPELHRYERRLSGPLLDRMDLLVNVERPTAEDLAGAPVTSSKDARAHVLEARDRQRHRLRGMPVTFNGELDAKLARLTIKLDPAAEQALTRAYTAGVLSARGRLRVLRVARTIADLEQHETVTSADLLKALSLRQRTGAEGVSRLGAAG